MSEQNPEQNPEQQPEQQDKEHGEAASVDHARVRFPPPLIFLLLIFAGFAVERLIPFGMGVPESFQMLGIAITLFGVAVVILINGSFKRNSTAIEPWKPSSKLITQGLYRYSRNPIYIGFCLFNMGIGIAMNSFWVFISFIPGAILVYYIAIAKEEAYLERAFGDEYLLYKSKVRRWL